MNDVCDYLKEHIGEVLMEWDRAIRHSALGALGEGDRREGLPELLLGLADAAVCDPRDRDIQRDKVLAAVRHGTRRKAQGLDEEHLLGEYRLLRGAIWRVIDRSFGSGAALDAIVRVDAAITLASTASLYAYHQEQSAVNIEELVDLLTQSAPSLPPAAERWGSR